MSKTNIITIQKGKPTLVENVLEGYPEYIKIMENVYAVKTDDNISTSDIRDNITKNCEDSLVFVMRSGVDAAWRITTNCSDWLKSNL